MKLNTTPIQSYLAHMAEILQNLLEKQSEAFAMAACLIADSIEHDRVVHLFGTGHSHMLAEEGLYRAGGLANFNPWLEPSLMLHAGARSSTAFERLSGVAALILDKYAPAPGEVLIVFSNSGVNAVPVEIAAGARARDVKVIAVTSRAYSLSVQPRHPTGKRLLDLADVVLDNHLPPGDGVIHISDDIGTIGPGSTVIGAGILNAILVGAVVEASRRGTHPPVYQSANMPGAAEHNQALTGRFIGRIHHL
jgi:uncharacterized phosphosugar-binding protein